MNLNILFLVLATLLTTTNAQIEFPCPPPEIFAPCTCSNTERSIYCEGPGLDLTSIFDNSSSYVDESTVFAWIRITSTDLTEIPAGAIKTFKFRDITIGENPNLRHVSTEAFSATYGVTTKLSFYQNRVFDNSEEGDGSGDIFDFVNKFEVLDSFTMTANAIPSIRRNAFANNTSIRDLYLGLDDRLRTIESGVVSGASNLQMFRIREGGLGVDSVSPQAFEGISSSSEVSLEFNSGLTFLKEEIFKPVLDSVSKLLVGGMTCGLWQCPTYQRLWCGPEADWICANEEGYRSKLEGFYCKSPSNHDTLWQYCAAARANSTK